MEVYLEVASYIYLSIVLYFYLKQKKVNTIENKIYKAIIITATLVCLSDAISTLYCIKVSTNIISDLLIKWKLVNMSLIMIFFTYYIFCLTSKKSAGIVDFEKHPHKDHFKKYGNIMIIWSTIIVILVICGDLKITYIDEVFEYTGTSLRACHIATVSSALLWVFMIIRIIKEFFTKKYRTLQMLIIIGVVTIIITIIFPVYSFSTPAIAFITAVIFFTMENPDATLITKLNEAKSVAEDANDAKTKFLSSMSHEIRTPLNAIVGFGQALAKEDISGTAKEEVQDILMASNTLLDIVNGILDIQKIESNKIELVNGEYNTKKIINEITSLINARIGSKPLDFKIIIDENLPAVLYGDSMRVKQVIINLLTNAVKYTEEGRILFQIRATNNQDICTLEAQVSDTGMGMTEEAVEQLFTKFQRFDVEKNVNIEGTGLGMAITKGLIELMNGDIKIKSKYGEGSTFTVTFDQKIISQKLTEEEERETNKEVKAFNASGQTILVVDDNKINLKVAERLLKDYQVTVETTNSGSESIDKILDGKKYDLIFMDIMMPKMNGIETLENLKNIVGFNMPVVALTADVISGMEDKYISQGFDDCLAKPIVEEELYYMLKKFLKEQDGIDVGPITTKDLETTDEHNIELLENNSINVKAGLELLKDMSMYEMTLEEFFNELQNKLNDLEKFKDEGSLDDYAILAHALKTEARYVGCNELGDIAYEHEMAGKSQNGDLIVKKFDELKNEANRVYDVIRRYFGK